MTDISFFPSVRVIFPAYVPSLFAGTTASSSTPAMMIVLSGIAVPDTNVSDFSSIDSLRGLDMVSDVGSVFDSGAGEGFFDFPEKENLGICILGSDFTNVGP